MYYQTLETAGRKITPYFSCIIWEGVSFLNVSLSLYAVKDSNLQTGSPHH
jgi:hypothetical protein